MTNDKKNGGFNKKVNSSKSNSTKGLKSDLKSTRKKTSDKNIKSNVNIGDVNIKNKTKSINKSKNDKKVNLDFKKKISNNDKKVLICFLLYLISFFLLVIGIIKYASSNDIKDCSNYFVTVMIFIVAATLLINVDFKKNGIKTITGTFISKQVTKKKRILEYFKESIFISLIITTFLALYIAVGDFFVDFYRLTTNLALNVIIIFVFLYICIFLLSYLFCYLYTEYRINKK